MCIKRRARRYAREVTVEPFHTREDDIPVCGASVLPQADASVPSPKLRRDPGPAMMLNRNPKRLCPAEVSALRLSDSSLHSGS